MAFSKIRFHYSASLLLCLLASACGGSGGGDAKAITLRFSSRINGDAFSCSRAYDGIGSTRQTVTPIDLRFYVSEVKLVAADGSLHALRMTEDGKNQHSNVALLDFEDGSGTCAEGDSNLKSEITGTADDLAYTGVQFSVGVPFALNHVDATTAAPPFNNSAMAWNWNFGFKFLKFDIQSPGVADGYRMHIGSTGCTGNEAGPNGSCSESNRVSVALDNFNPEANTIVGEFGALLRDNDVNYNTPETAPGCMSGEDPECSTIFPKLGLPYPGTSSAGQELFFVE